MAMLSTGRLPALLAAAVASIAVAGCGGDEPAEQQGGEGDIKGTTMTFVSYGGAYQDAQKKAMTDPFQQKFGVEVQQDGPTDYAKLTTQIESGQVTWDVVDADPFFAIQQCKKMVEPIDTSVVDTSKMPEELVSECSVPSMTYSFALFYDKKFAADPPKGWADFFNTEKYPGKRALQNLAQGGGYEAALLADGVPSDELFPIDYDRALKKLDTIKEDLVFWDTGAQSQQMMESGEVVMLLAWSGRGYTAIKNGASYEPQWNQNMAVYDVFMVPKGTTNKAAAMKFISYATGAEAQARLTETIPYAPIHADADPKVDEQLKSFLPTQPDIREKAVVIDQEWWAENLDAATQKWTAWVGG
jgi:putative spermidine/putrescine transport system substrate-binding protein